MDVSVVLTLVQTTFQLLESSISEEIISFCGFKSQLEKLKNTMSTIQDVLTRVERLESQQLPMNISEVTLERLEDAVYEADDLFDEVATAAHLKGLMPGNKLSKEVRLFFSNFNQLSHTFTKSREIRKIRGVLDDIAKDHREFGNMVPSQCHHDVVGVRNMQSSSQTGYFVAEEDIIGRDEDKQIVKNFLLDTSLDDTISFVSIVGLGGLGKTALVQSVYQDDTIKAAFSPKMWVCVSDDFNVISLLNQIQAEATSGTTRSGFSKAQLQTQVLQQLRGKKYLLVLDDVWNEDGFPDWYELKQILVQGEKGSRIIVTTRSTKVAEVAGSHRTHILNGLSDDDSWKLFQKMILKQQDQMEPHLVEIGKDIVRKCSNNPLAIRFVGSFLQGKDEREWERLNKNDLAEMKKVENKGIISVLKISYNHLPSCVKSCFSYCAVFPKDYQFKKEELICLWMAQGFVRGSDLEDLADLENLAEDCFRMLLQRCFFQNVYEDEATGNVLSCKMHDLVHDLAIDVSRIKIVESPVNKFGSSWDKKTRHIFIDDTLFKTQEDVERYLGKMKRFRTCILRLSNPSKFNHAELTFKMRNLRVLDLSRKRIEKLPSMIGEMLHLRYLDLSYNNGLCKLPNSITQLYNLQTLKLNCCRGLKELPRDLSKLVNLRHLDLYGCDSLRHMPGRMNSMRCLHKLTKFVVGKKAGDVGKLEDIKDLNNLRDSIEIKIKDGWRIYDAEKVKEGGYLIHKSLLNEIIIEWDEEWSHVDGDAEALLQGLQPHPNIKKLLLFIYPGVGFPRWGNYSSMNLAESLPNLVEIFLLNCTRLESLPLLSQLRHLKSLGLSNLTKLEYVESSSSRNGDNELVFFPLLTKLSLENLPELKGWWKDSTSTSTSPSQVEMEATSTAGEGGEIARGDVNQIKNEVQLSLFLGFPSLSTLQIFRCHKLETLPGLPKLKMLKLSGLDKMVKMPKVIQHLTSLVSLEIDFSNVEEIPGWIGCLSSLQHLIIYNCLRVKSLPEEMRHLTCLTHLYMYKCSEELKERCKNPTGVDWPKIKHIRRFRCYCVLHVLT